MGTELVRACVKEENMDIPSIPPGFESLTAFTLKRVEDNEITSSSPVSASASESQTAHVDMEFDCYEGAKITRSLRRRPWIKYDRYDNSSGDESDSEQQSHPLRPRLPKGVVRGCEECSNCQKVTAGWHPEEACRPEVQDAPVFYPNEEEFKDTLKYIASIHHKAEAYGICRIVPPPSWRPPCPLRQKDIWEASKFNTRLQRVDKLQNRTSMSKIVKFNNNHKRRKKRRCMKTGGDHRPNDADILGPDESASYEAGFGFEPGPEFTLDAFQKFADDFKAQYFRKNKNQQEQWEPTLENIEGEYWRMVEKPTEEIEVLYGADLETGVFGSGFPKLSNQVGPASDEKYVESGWNLNNFPRLPGSVLSYESSDISGVLVPWLYIGMCFSSFCWHVEDHHLYSLNYMHWGAPKMWYGVPGKDALKLEAAMRKHLPDLFEEQPDLLHKLVTQLSPSILKSEDVPVFRCVQNPGEFVLTFPRAYHAGFNCGFNCAEAVNVAPVDWLPHGHNAIELYREQARKTSISHDKLLLGAARDAVKAHWEINLLRKNSPDNLRWKDVCGKDGILSKALKARVEMERVRREFLCNSSQTLKMESGFDATSERECSVCLFDLHLSAAGCHYCSPDKYACLNHAKQLCSCSWGAKFFLFRYDINELNILVEALEGKLSAIYRWARLDLGLALSSFVSSKESSRVLGRNGHLSYLPQKAKPPRDIVHSEDLKVSSTSHLALLALEAPKPNLTVKKEDLKLLPNIRKSGCQPGNLATVVPEVKKPPVSVNDGVIVLSDDEGEESNVTLPEKSKHVSPERLSGTCDMVSHGNCIKDPVLKTPLANAAMMDEKDATMLPDGERKPFTKEECQRDTEIVHDSNMKDLSCQELSVKKESGDCNMANAGSSLQSQPCESLQSQPYDSNKLNKEDIHKTIISDPNPQITDNVQTVSGSPSSAQNNLDRYFRQKGPRIAKVVRRINCNVEPLQYGVVQSGKLWCDSRGIYPKGFRSRVRYINILDPASMCNYVSEILDVGQDRPMFMVSLENFPSEVFVHISAARCWEMVRERVNQEITKQHKLGKLKLPPLQPPGSLDGVEMFGFSSPAIIQVIQSMDRNRVCQEYWKSRPLMQIPQHSQPAENSSGTPALNYEDACKGDNKLPSGVDTVLCGLFKKANPEELQSLLTIFNNNNPSTDRDLVINLLDKELNRRPR